MKSEDKKIKADDDKNKEIIDELNVKSNELALEAWSLLVSQMRNVLDSPLPPKPSEEDSPGKLQQYDKTIQFRVNTTRTAWAAIASLAKSFTVKNPKGKITKEEKNDHKELLEAARERLNIK